MWSLLSIRYQWIIIVAIGTLIATCVQAIFTIIRGEEALLFSYISLTVSILVGGLALIFDTLFFKILDRFPKLQTMTFPNLNGTWKGHLMSTWVNPETGSPPPPIPTTITIRQRLLSTHISLKTGESRSESTRSVLERFPDTKRFRVWYSYNNDPSAQVRKRSSPHEGVAFLEMHWDENPSKLIGTYYTARMTTGTIEVIRASRDHTLKD